MTAIKKLSLLVTCSALTCTAWAQKPVLNAVLNNASYAYTGLPNSGIAQGSIFVLFGTNLGATGATATFPLSTNLNGTAISVTVNGTTVAAWPLYTTPGQVGAVLPSTTPVGNGTVTLTYNSQTSDPLPINVVASSFGTFSINQQGNGPGIITDANYQVITLAHSAAPGQTLIIWGTGLGPVPAGTDEASGAVPKDLTNIPVEVIVGGQNAAITYRGRSGCCAGLDQIAFVVPQGVSGCSVSVAVKINNVVSNTTTMAVGNNGQCSDPNGLSQSDLDLILKNGKFGYVSLDRTTTQFTLPPPLPSTPTTTDEGSAVFYNIDASKILNNGAQLPFQTASFGSCTVITIKGDTSGNPQVTPSPFQGLDAGAAISVQGPGGTKSMPTTPDEKGFYGGQLGGGSGTTATPLFLDPGTYTISNGAGGADVGAFSIQLAVPAALTWSNKDAVSTVIRANGQPITWTGGDPNGDVTITGTSFTASEPVVGAIFTCTAKVSAGQFTIPAAVLLALPPSQSISAGDFSFSTSTLSVGSSTMQKLTIPGLDVAYGSAGASTSKNVTYQ